MRLTQMIFLLVPAVIFLIIIIVLVRNALPRIISFLLPDNRRLYFEESPRPQVDEAKWAMIRPAIEKFESLGFKQLGIMVEKLPLWGPGSREVSLASAADRAFASIGLRRRKPSYFLYTPFTGGQVVITAYNAFRDSFKDDFATATLSTTEPAEMLEVHKAQVEKFIDKGFTPFSDYGRESVIEATRLYYRSPYPRRQLRIAGTVNLLFLLLCIFVFVLLVKAAIG